MGAIDDWVAGAKKIKDVMSAGVTQQKELAKRAEADKQAKANVQQQKSEVEAGVDAIKKLKQRGIPQD